MKSQLIAACTCAQHTVLSAVSAAPLRMDFVAVHAGAGYHSEERKEAYARACTSACAAGMTGLQRSSSPLDAVVAAIRVMEDVPLTNCGYGSNLCTNETVECDSSVMTGANMRWAGVGCLSGIKNPVAVAKRLHAFQGEHQVCGLIPPCLLVGAGATQWALEQKCSQPANLVTESSRKTFLKYKERVDQAKLSSKRCKRMDTVGAIAISKSGETASGVSSGGVFLKVPGRVGQGASYASGCWSEACVAVTTSGVGEHLIKTQLARAVAQDLLSPSDDKLPHDLIKDSFTSRFSDSRCLSEIEPSQRLAGVIAGYRHPERKTIELFCAHNTQSMVYAYQSSDMKSASCHLSRFDKDTDGRVKVNVVLL